MASPLESLVSEKEFAAFVGVSLATVRRWRRFGRMPWVGFGRQIKVPVELALRWAENRTRDPERTPFLSRPSPPSRRARRPRRGGQG